MKKNQYYVQTNKHTVPLLHGLITCAFEPQHVISKNVAF